MLHKKGNTHQWDIACQEAFAELKHWLGTPPILAYPYFKLPFFLYTDTSDFALGWVLGQVQDGKERDKKLQ